MSQTSIYHLWLLMFAYANHVLLHGKTSERV